MKNGTIVKKPRIKPWYLGDERLNECNKFWKLLRAENPTMLAVDVDRTAGKSLRAYESKNEYNGRDSILLPPL